jgi:hypothetical protein
MRIQALSAVVLAAVVSSSARGQFTLSSPAIAGISCDRMEGNRLHIHQHHAIFDHGKAVSVPENVGQRPLSHCLYWVHTHTPDGIIHIEAPTDRAFTLGDFFQVWGQPLSTSEVATVRAPKGSAHKVWVDGKAYAGDPRKIKLESHTDIVIEAGPPFPTPPRFTNWGTL